MQGLALKTMLVTSMLLVTPLTFATDSSLTSSDQHRRMSKELHSNKDQLKLNSAAGCMACHQDETSPSHDSIGNNQDQDQNKETAEKTSNLND
jgi:cytochrome c553